MTKEHITWRCNAKTMWRLIQSAKIHTCANTLAHSPLFSNWDYGKLGCDSQSRVVIKNKNYD